MFLNKDTGNMTRRMQTALMKAGVTRMVGGLVLDIRTGIFMGGERLQHSVTCM